MERKERKEGYYYVLNNDQDKTPMIAEWYCEDWYVAGLTEPFKDSDFSYISSSPIPMEQPS